MKILAIESSGPVASAAIWQDGKLLAEERGEFKITHSETLLPLTAKVVDETETKLSELDVIAVSGGPGSFTGLRIGSATAKGLGLALEKPLVHVPTLEAMACNFFGCGKLVVPLMDARRGQVYAGIYKAEADEMKTLVDQCAIAATDLIAKLNEIAAGQCVVFLGDGVEVSKGMISENAAFEYEFAEGENLFQRASSVAFLGEKLALEGKTINADDEAPEYLRPSQAERVRAEKLSDEGTK